MYQIGLLVAMFFVPWLLEFGRQTEVCPTGWLTIISPSPRVFPEVFILKTLKVDCFYGFTEVFILKGLIGLICTRIVQVSEVLQTKGLGLSTGYKNKNASKMLALR